MDHKDTYKILSSHIKATRCTYNSLVWLTIMNSPFWLLTYVRGKDYTNRLCTCKS